MVARRVTQERTAPNADKMMTDLRADAIGEDPDPCEAGIAEGQTSCGLRLDTGLQETSWRFKPKDAPIKYLARHYSTKRSWRALAK